MYRLIVKVQTGSRFVVAQLDGSYKRRDPTGKGSTTALLQLNVLRSSASLRLFEDKRGLRRRETLSALLYHQL